MTWKTTSEGKRWWFNRVTLSEEEYNILTEVFATAILMTQDESGDFIPLINDLAEVLGLTNDVADQMATLVRRAEANLEPHRRG